jgi:hypothetical protein
MQILRGILSFPHPSGSFWSCLVQEYGQYPPNLVSMDQNLPADAQIQQHENKRPTAYLLLFLVLFYILTP